MHEMECTREETRKNPIIIIIYVCLCLGLYVHERIEFESAKESATVRNEHARVNALATKDTLSEAETETEDDDEHRLSERTPAHSASASPPPGSSDDASA